VYEDRADTNRHDEKWLNRSLHDLLKRDRQKELFFLPNRQLTTHRATATFDFAWQNGSFNLVKTLGFDLQHPESILNKSNLWFGKLTQLGGEIEQQHAKVDFLLAPPQSNNPALHDAFAGAVEVLSNINVPHSLYYADHLLQYADHALQTVQAPPQNIFSLPSKD